MGEEKRSSSLSPRWRGGSAGEAGEGGCRRAMLAGLVLFLVLAGSPATAQDAPVHGRFEVQDAGDFFGGDSLAADFGAAQAHDVLANLRLTWEPTRGPWSLDIQSFLTVENGPLVRLARAEAGLLPAPPSTWFSLTGVLVDSGPTLATVALDRLSLGYATPQWVVRVGRQALTWGSGLVFRPMDLFDPFSPIATDTEYKPGVDMLYIQRLFADGSDLQLVVVPRPPLAGEAPSSDASSVALHYQKTLLGQRTTWLVARDHGDWVGGFGVNGPLKGATWNLEIVPTALQAEGVRVSGLANISDALAVMGRNATVFAEYFHNGFGVLGDVAYADLPPGLADRLARGQVFNIRQDYLAGGMTVELNPLVSIGPTVIVDLDDGSLFLLATGTFSLSDNLILIAGAQAPVGRAGSEFGGLPLTPGAPLLLAPPSRVYLQLRRYF